MPEYAYTNHKFSACTLHVTKDINQSHTTETKNWSNQFPETFQNINKESKSWPFGHSATILSFSIATVEAGEYLNGPMSDPSYNLNFNSTKSSSGISHTNPTINALLFKTHRLIHHNNKVTPQFFHSSFPQQTPSQPIQT